METKTRTFEISEGLNKKIIGLCEKADLKMYWDYRDELDEKQINEILEDGIETFEEEIYEYNMYYMSEQIDYYLQNILLPEVQDELLQEFEKLEPDQSEAWYVSMMLNFILNYRDYLSYDMNISELLSRVRNINCIIKVYSNFDSCNSFDMLTDDTYLKEVYRRVQKGVHLRDYMKEFHNGAYGGSLFCFAFSTSLERLIELKQQEKNGEAILIPKGTQIGFFSDFSGSGSMFELETYKDFELPLREKEDPDYNNVDILADCQQHYSMYDVYGGIELKKQNIQII